MKEGVGDEVREVGEGVVGVGREGEGEAFSTYHHETNAFLLSLISGAPLEFNTKMNKTV